MKYEIAFKLSGQSMSCKWIEPISTWQNAKHYWRMTRMPFLLWVSECFSLRYVTFFNFSSKKQHNVQRNSNGRNRKPFRAVTNDKKPWLNTTASAEHQRWVNRCQTNPLRQKKCASSTRSYVITAFCWVMLSSCDV